MKNLFIIFGLLILGCQEQIVKNNKCQTMILSDAQPIQFWLTNCDTYNEKEVCGVHPKCFCQPFECDDELKFQFRSNTTAEYKLLILDESDTTLHTLDFEKTGEDIYNASFIPSELSPGICDQRIKFQIKLGNDIAYQWLFEDDLDGWTVVPLSSGHSWNHDTAFDGSIKSSLDGVGTRILNYDVTLGSNTYRVYFSLYVDDSTGPLSNLDFNVIFRDAADTMIITSGKIIDDVNVAGFYSGYIELTPIQAAAIGKIRFYADQNPNVNPSGQIYVLDASVVNMDSEETEILAKSDCIEIKSTQRCSYLIEYTNHRDLSSLNFNQDSSPIQTFYLRVPAVFFHEQFPQEQEVLELSNSEFVELNSKLEAKRLMKTDYMPYYMHRKLMLVLMAQTITIDGQNWIKRDAYEIVEGNERWPVKFARVLLTETDNVQRNVL